MLTINHNDHIGRQQVATITAAAATATAATTTKTTRNPALALNGDLIPGHGIVHVMFDRGSPLANTYRHCFETPQISDETALGPSTSTFMAAPSNADNLGDSETKVRTVLRSVKESILLQMLSFEFDLGDEEANKGDPLGLSRHSDTRIDEWYAQARIVEKRVIDGLPLDRRCSFEERITASKLVREALLGKLMVDICGTRHHGFHVQRCENMHRVGTLSAQSPPDSSLRPPPLKVSLLSNNIPSISPPNDMGDPVIRKAGFTSSFQFRIPNLDFR